MADLKISQLTAVTPTTDDIIPVVDLADNTTKKATIASLPVSTATQTALDAKLDDSQLDTDGTLAANSDTKIASQKATKTYADTKVTANGAIVGATKTKITYDTKGLVTAGADATTADIASSTDKRYVTDAQLVIIGNTSGTNTGDQTTITGNAGTATALQTARSIYGNNFDGTANLTQVIASTYGGTGNGFTKFTGPTTSEKTFTLPDSNATLLYSGGTLGIPSGGTLTNATGLPLSTGVTGELPVANGGTGVASFTAYSVVCAGTTSTGDFTNVSGVGIAGQVLTSNGAGAYPTWQSAGGFTWGASVSGSSGVGLTLTKQSGATYNADFQVDYDGSPSMRFYRNFIGTTNTFATIDFNSKLDDGTANRNFASITAYTISQASSASYNGGLLFSFTNSGSGANKFGFDYLGRATIGDYTGDVTEGGANGLLFASGTAATITNNTRGFLYNNSGTLTWVNSGADNQLALNIPNSASSIKGQTITVGNTQANPQICQELDTGTAAIANVAQSIKVYNASTTAYGTKYDTSTTGTGVPVYFSTGGSNRKAIKFDTGFTSATAPTGASKYIIIDIGGTEYRLLAQATS